MYNSEMVTKYTITLELLGGLIEVRCKYKECLEGIKSFFPTVVTESWTNPDIIIYCDWKEAGRYLFRTSPSTNEENPTLKGVYYKEMGDKEFNEWDSYNPPLPPFEKKPFKNTFVGLHSGAIKGNHNDAMLFIGERGSGKTTSTLELVNKYEDYSLITDETVFIRNRSCVVEPFPRLILPRKMVENNIRKYSLPADKAYKSIANDSSIISHGFVLKRGIGEPYIKPISSFEAYRNIVEHYLYAGTSLSDSMYTLSMITRKVPFSIINHSSYEDLIKVIHRIPSYLKEKTGMIYAN